MRFDGFPLPNLARRLVDLGATEVLVKHLAPNDNGKNQIYMAGDLSSLGKIHTGAVEFHPGNSSKKRGGAEGERGPIFQASVPLEWISEDPSPQRAPGAKLIAYPQYSEVRLSGIIKGAKGAPAELFNPKKRGREPGRVLLLAPAADGTRVLCAVFSWDTPEAKALSAVRGDPYGVMQRFDLRGSGGAASSEQLLTDALAKIHLSGWLEPVHLSRDGRHTPCKGPNCGGVTLETHLGIRANGKSEPDFHGWEIKQHGVVSLLRPRRSRITLMTPEPSGGAYVENGPDFFVQTWGYSDRKGRDRRNFGGIYRSGGSTHSLTGLRLHLDGYDAPSRTFRGDGSVMLVDGSDTVAASWSFAKLMDHWRRKHAQAAYVPSESRRSPQVQYRYGNEILLAEGAQFRLLLQAFAEGAVYYDPAIKLEPGGELKRRSQFRVSSDRLHDLYETTRTIDVLAGGST